MKLLFVLPRYTRSAIGGHKIIYEYANRMCEKGYDVNILFINDWIFPEYNLPLYVKNAYANIATKLEPHWFNLNKKIKKISAKNNNYKNSIKDCDVVIYTAAQTVGFVDDILINAKKIYFIQDYEDFLVKEDELIETYKKGYTNIVISNWLKEIVDGYSKTESILIPNPIDTNIYKVNTPIEDRKKHSVAFLYHINSNKGSKYSIEVIKKLKEKYDDLEVYGFGTYKLKERIPGLVKYTYKASTEETVEIYNSASIFICSSTQEGFGLPAFEAMSCGTALVSTDFPTVHEYAKNNENALLSPIKDIDSMFNNIVKLFENDKLRYKLANSGIEIAKEFDWSLAVDKFERHIK